MKIYGFLRETTELAKKSGIDKTGLDEYLSVIFPNVHDWVHDKNIENIKSKRRPDYRSESLKLIVEFDGIQHYTNPLNIEHDRQGTLFYESLGYKVIRIPYFIQLTNKAVKHLFDVDVKEQLFNENVPSLSITAKNTPAFLCLLGIKRMAEEFKKFPEQYEVNVNYLKSINNNDLTGIETLENFYCQII